MPVTDNRPLNGWRLALLSAVLGVATVVILSNVPGYTVLVPYAAGSLQGVNPSFGSWGTTDHMIGIALGLPISRWIAARFGDYRTLTAAYILYAIVSLICTMSQTIAFFLPMRILLGLTGGVILPIAQSIVLNEYPEHLRTVGVGLWGMLGILPFMVGVFMGGWYSEHLGWRYLFYMNIPVTLLAAGVVISLYYGRGFRRRFPRFDVVGFFLLAAILFGLQTIFNMGNDFDWFASPILATALVIVIVALPIFIIWSLGERHPALDLRLFGNRNYAVAVICSMAGFLIIQGTLSLFVGQLQLLLGYSSDLAGLVYMSMLLFAAPVAAIVHELCKSVDVRLVSCLNFIGVAVTLTWIGLYDKQASFDQIALPMTFFGFSLAMFFAPLATIAMRGLQGAQLIRAAEELALLRTAAGAFGISLQAVVQFRRTPVHVLDLSDQFSGRRYAELDQMSELSNRLQTMLPAYSAAMARSQVAIFLKQEASLLALNDAFLLGAFVFALLAAFIWFARSTHVPRLSGAQELKQLKAEELMEQP
jgi:DHA2 family multidrug resistance protein